MRNVRPTLVGWLSCLVVAVGVCLFGDEETMESMQVTPKKLCLYQGERSCDSPPEGKCTSQKCEVSHYVTTQVDTDGDGEEDASQTTPVYKCNGKIGYYNAQATYPSCEVTGLESDDVDGAEAATSVWGTLYEEIDAPVEFYCWQKKGCPTSGCTEITDVDDPDGAPYAICADGPHDPINDPESKRSSTKCKGTNCPKKQNP